MFSHQFDDRTRIHMDMDMDMALARVCGGRPEGESQAFRGLPAELIEAAGRGLIQIRVERESA